jgi:hypothetical protein
MTKAEVILKAIERGATDAELATLEATTEDQFNNEEVGKPSGTAARANAGVVPVSTDLEQEGISSELASLNIDDKTLTLDGVKKDVVVEKDNKPKYLDFNQWHTNDDGETSMVEKLEKLHPDYDIAEAVRGDDVVSIKRKGDKEGIEVRLQTKWTDNADHSRGYRKYLDYVGGEDVDKTLNDYHDKTIGKYKQVGKDGKVESDEAFFKRTLPKFGVISSQNEYSSTEESYSEISGVRKTSSGVYVKASGGKASKEEKEMYEQMSFLHDLKKRSDKTREGTLSQEFDNKSNIVLQSQLGDKKSDKNLIKDVGDKTTFTAANYGSFVKDEAYKNFQEKALEIYAAEKVRGNEELQVAIDAFLPRARVETTQHFQPQYTALKAEQDEIIAKRTPGAKEQTTKHFQPRYDALEREQKAIVEKVSPSVIAQYQKEINAGLWDHKSQEELNAELNRRINGYLSGMQEKYDKVNVEANTYLNDLLNNSLGGMQAKYDKVNEEANAYLNKIYQKEQEDPKSDFSKIINKITNNADNAIKAIQQEFFNTWKPEPNLISEAKYEEISKVLDKGGFANLNTNDKKLALTKQWNLLSDQLDDNMSVEMLAGAEKEFWSVNYSKLDKDKDGKFSQFIMKGVAQDQLGIINDAINLEIERIRPDYKESPLRTAKEEDKYIRRLAIESLGKKDPSFKNYNQVERYLDKIINSPETMSNSGMVNFWRGLTSKQGHEYLPFASGIISTQDSYIIKNITDKDPKDRTEEEKTLISIMAMKNETAAKVSKMSVSYDSGAMVADMLPFVGEMVATSGLAGIVGKATTTASRAFLFPKVLQLSGQTAVNVAEGASKTFGYLMGNAARTVASPQRFMDQTYQNMTSEMGLMLSDEGTGLVAMVDENTGQEWDTAFARGFGSTWAEYVSEGLGEKLPGVNRYMRKKLFGDPEWMKRIAIGRYLRKKGLSKSEAVTHFLTQKIGYNGVFGEIAEEIINTPVQNWINGQEIFEGMNPFHSDPEKAKEGLDFYKKLVISMSASGFVFSTGSIGYNAMRGNKESSYFVGTERFANAREQKREVERLRDAGLLTANTYIEVNNDFEAYDEISGITDAFGFKGLVKSVSGTSKAIQDKIAATELEVADAIRNNHSPEKADKLIKELEDLELKQAKAKEQKDLIAFDENIPEETRVEEVKIQQRIINAADARRKRIIDPFVKKIELKKKTKLYNENLISVQKRAEKLYGKDMPIVETNSEKEAAEELSIEFDKEISDLKAKLTSGKSKGPSIPAIERADNEIRQQIEALEKEKADLLKGFDRVQGFITPPEINGKKVGQRIIINRNHSLKSGAINVAGHEFFHNVLQATIRQNPETAIALGGALENVLKNLDPRQFRDSKLRQRIKSYQVSETSMRRWAELEAIESELGKDSPQWKTANAALQGSRVRDAATAGEEMLTLLSDALASGDLQYNETVFTRIGDAIRKALTAMGIRADFRDGRDVFNFVRDYNKTIASGKAFDKQQLRIIKEGATFGGELKESAADVKEQVEDFAPGARGVYFSKDDPTKEQDIEVLAINPETVEGGIQFYRDKVRDYESKGLSTEKAKEQAFKDYSEEGERFTNENWIEGVGAVYESLMYGNALNGLIRNIGTKLQGDNVFNYPIEDFFKEVKEKLDVAIMNFKPGDNNNFSGWIGFHVAKKKPGVLDTFKKRAEEKKADASPTLAPSVTEVTGGIVVASRFGEVVAATGKTTVETKVDKIVDANFRTHKDPQKYKEVKQALVSVEKIKDPKTGKMKSPSKVEDVVATGPLYPVLQVFAKEFGVDPRKILGNIALTKTERRSAQQALNKLGVETTLKLFPEGFTESGDATGMPTSILNAINPETGEPNLIYTKIGRKQNLDLQKKNNIKSINIAAAANVFGITQMGEMNRFDTENRLVDGPLRTVITQLATLAAGQSMVKQAEADGNFNRFAGIKDGKSGFAFSMDTLSDLDIDRRLEFLDKVDGVLSVLKPGFGKNTSIPKIIYLLKKTHGDLFTDREYKKIATEMKGLFDTYQSKVTKYPSIKEEAWTEMIADLKQDPLDAVFTFLGIDSKATEVFDDEVNINRMRQSIPALGNWMLEQGFSHDKIAEVMLVLQPAYAGNSQMSRKHNFKEDEKGYAVKISDDIRTKKQGGTMSSPRNQSFPKVDSYVDYGVMAIDGMEESGAWEKAKEKIKLRRQSAVDALKSVEVGGNTTLEAEIKADAELARTALDYMMDFLIASPNHDNLDIGMFLVSNLSHMEAPIRRAAVFSDVIEGLTDPKHANYIPAGTGTPKEVAAWMKENGIKDHDKVAEIKPFKTVKKIVKGKKVSVKVPNKIPYRNKYTVVYEHSIPANQMAYRLAYYKLTNQWDNNFWDKYTVAAITKAMDDVLKKNGLQSMSNPGFVFKDPNSSQHDRYYGPLNYGEVAMLPIKNIFTGSITAPLPLVAGYKMSRDVSKAISNTRTPSEPRGITVLDFDDTLATTKSGVRANIPNSDGLPKPGRKVIFLAGGAGSGKGNVISKLGLKDQGFKVVNSDISLEWLKKNSGLPENMNDFTKEQRSKLGSLQYQARGIAKRKMMKYQGEGGGVVVDGTGGSIKSMENLVNEFKAKGYDVSMVFTETSLDVALERNAARKERSLLDKIVEKNHEAVQGNKDGFKEMFGDRFMEVNTDNLSQKDAMPSKLTNKMNDFVSGYENRRLDAEEFARDGASILEQGGTFDFSEFNEVVEGQTAPLFEKAMKLQEKFGNKDMFVLTARPAESADAIHAFLTANGLNIPLENITGLANSTAEAKALWMAEKVGEGYNDFYFADDALQNVKAVQNMLDQFDVKSKVQQAKADFVKGDPQVVKLLEESSINNVKSVDGLTNPGTYNNIKFSKSHRAEYENTIAKYRPDLVKDKLVSKTVDSMFDYIDSLDVPTDKRRKYEKITTKWLATSNVKLGEDGYKIQQAVELAEKHNKDIFSYNNPNEIIEAYAGKSKAEPTNPKNVKEFGEGRVFNKKHGITVHEVEDTKEGMMAVRKVADTHWGPKSNPWCIIARSEKQRVEPRQYGYESVATKAEAQARKQQLESEGFTVEIRAHKKDYRGIYPGKSIDGKRVDMRYELDIKEVKEGPGIMEDAWQNWTVYDKSRKYIVFQNGRLSSFYADDQYWDRMDNPTDAPVIQIKEGNVTSKVELVPIGDGNVEEFVMETRTVSEDKKTVTTEILHETQDGYEVGTKIIENRVNGVLVKSTRTSADGVEREIINFDKSGKATNNVTFNPEGQARAINRYGIPFGEMSINDIVQEKGDLLSHEVNDGDISYYYGDVLMNGQKTEIGWGMPSNLDLRDFVKTSPNGEVRADIKKILEVDPNAKGLPKSNVMFSKSMNQNFNDILEGSTGVGSTKEFSDAQARLRGQKTKYKSIIPASAQDFQGLLYSFLGKGKQGEKDMAFFKKALIDPFARAINELNASRQSAANDFENLNKSFPDTKKILNEKIDGVYTVDQAIRVYLWDKAGFEVPGLSKRDLKTLVDFVQGDPKIQAYADAIGLISKKDAGYSKPKDYWLAESIASDLLSDGAIGDARAEFLKEWIQNKNIIFSKENLNKIEAIYGSNFREALEDMLYRMETGRNRPTGGSRLVNGYMNWVNNSVGAIMFINMRSATLQTISATNYLNWTDNNPAKAAAAFANQPQFWSDFSMIWNSPYLKQRRSGNQRGINEAELSEAIAGSDNKAKAALAWLLKKGFTPTQLADSFAISMGGATFLRNRINKYVKEGMSQKDAEAKAWIDFQETTEVNQQSARPDMISQQQASPLGRLILAFQNTPMQYARIMNKATRDLANGRGDYKTHISKIAYYGFVQSIIFGALQSALYASLGDDDEEDFDKKKERILNQMVDSWLSGIGVGGKAIGTVKNTIMEYFEQRDKGWNADHAYTLLTILSFSPPIGSKLRKIYSSIKTEEFNRGVFEKRGFSLDNPIWSGIGNVIEGVTNAPLGRMANLMLQLDNAMDSSHAWWQRVALILGQNTWDLGIKDPDIEAVKGELAEEKKVEANKRAVIKKEEKKKEKIEASKVVVEENKKKSKKDGICSAISKSGARCKTKVVEGDSFCTVHEKAPTNSTGIKSQCKKIKDGGKQCGMQTANKSGLCYYHD